MLQPGQPIQHHPSVPGRRPRAPLGPAPGGLGSRPIGAAWAPDQSGRPGLPTKGGGLSAGPAYTPVVRTPPPGWIATNRRKWDERVPLHVASDFYDVAAFKAGHPQIEPFEVDELGALGGLRLAHLQCHFGLDTLDLVRMHPTLDAVGLDFSGPAIEAAQTLAGEVGLAGRARFVHADVHGAASVLGASAFDVVYTGKGALCWLPDLRQWAEQCALLLRPGGWLYVCEFHPVGYCLDERSPMVKYDYFATEAHR